MVHLRRGIVGLGIFLFLLASCAQLAPAQTLVVTAAAGSSADGRELHVAKSGQDSNDGSAAHPWLTLQHAVDQALPGDRIQVHEGEYAGCRIERSGTADLPITLQAAPGETVLIATPGPNNRHESNIEVETWEGDGVVAHWIISGFDVRSAPGWGIDVRGNEQDHSQDITIANNRVHHNGINAGKTGIFAAFSDHVTVENNESFENGEHGVYINNSSDNFIVRGNHLHDNPAAGVHLNGDASFGGDGMMSDGVISENTIHDNGQEGGAAINMDGVEDTLVVNNLIYNNHASGIALYQQDGAACSRRNSIWFNTVQMPEDSRWALIIDGPDCADNQILNNIFLTDHEWRGSISIVNDAPGLQSDFNIVADRFTVDDGNTVLSLAQWQALGYDAASFVATADELFVSKANDDYRLRPGSPAIDAGTALPEVTGDIAGAPRPSGDGFDIGAYEFVTAVQSSAIWLPMLSSS